MTEDALALFRPVFRDLVVELVNVFDCHLHPLQIVLGLLHIPRHVTKLPLMVVDRVFVPPDLVHGGLQQCLECLGAREEDFTRMPDNIHMVVELVIPCTGRENDMPGGKNVDLVTVTVF